MGRLVVRTTAVVLMAGCLFGCSKSGLSRDQLELRYVDGLIDAGVPTATAECVIGKFFDELDDDQLRAFNVEGSALSAAQQARIGELTTLCTGA